MAIYFFVSCLVPKVRAFTSDETGANLSDDYAPWERSQSSVPLPRDESRVADAVQQRGFFLVTGRDPLGKLKRES